MQITTPNVTKSGSKLTKQPLYNINSLTQILIKTLHYLPPNSLLKSSFTFTVSKTKSHNHKKICPLRTILTKQDLSSNQFLKHPLQTIPNWQFSHPHSWFSAVHKNLSSWLKPNWSMNCWKQFTWTTPCCTCSNPSFKKSFNSLPSPIKISAAFWFNNSPTISMPTPNLCKEPIKKSTPLPLKFSDSSETSTLKSINTSWSSQKTSSKVPASPSRPHTLKKPLSKTLSQLYLKYPSQIHRFLPKSKPDKLKKGPKSKSTSVTKEIWKSCTWKLSSTVSINFSSNKNPSPPMSTPVQPSALENSVSPSKSSMSNAPKRMLSCFLPRVTKEFKKCWGESACCHHSKTTKTWHCSRGKCSKW